jgi:uncharacterized membrane protein
LFDLINGIPVHPLVVHAIVVLLPLATLGTIAIAVRPRWRSTYGPLVVVAALAAVVLCPVATSSGEAFEKRVGDPGQHAALGDTLVWFALALLVTSAAVVWLERRHQRRDEAARPVILTVVTIVAVLVALASAVQVYRVGDSGARAAWGTATSSSSGD